MNYKYHRKHLSSAFCWETTMGLAYFLQKWTSHNGCDATAVTTTDDAAFRSLGSIFIATSSHPSDKWVCQGFFPIVLGLLPQTNCEEKLREKEDDNDEDEKRKKTVKHCCCIYYFLHRRSTLYTFGVSALLACHSQSHFPKHTSFFSFLSHLVWLPWRRVFNNAYYMAEQDLFVLCYTISHFSSSFYSLIYVLGQYLQLNLCTRY